LNFSELDFRSVLRNHQAADNSAAKGRISRAKWRRKRVLASRGSVFERLHSIGRVQKRGRAEDTCSL